jgi:hypothetical protein
MHLEIFGIVKRKLPEGFSPICRNNKIIFPFLESLFINKRIGIKKYFEMTAWPVS